MNDETVKNILHVIKKSSDKKVVLKALVKLRTDVVKDREGIIIFRDAGGIPPMVKLLNRPNERILEVALSILGNCCTNSECCSQVFELKIIPPLVTILKSVANPAIQNRACRLLGNLAKENRTQLIIQCTVIAQSLCLILEESIVSMTTLMAIRAVKFLIVDRQFMKYYLEYDGFIILMKILVKIMKKKDNLKEKTTVAMKTTADSHPPIGLKCNEHREKYFQEVACHLEGVRSDIFDYEMLKYEKIESDFIMPDDKIELDITSEILKCVQIISEFQLVCFAKGLYYSESAFSCIVFCAQDNNPFRAIALQIISNFSKNRNAISALGAADAVIAACNLLTSEKLKTELSELEIKYSINTICMLSSDACNRAKIRRSGALKKLIEIAKVSHSYSKITLILYAFVNFQYDNISMDLMLHEGLVTILIKELNAYLNGDDERRKKKCEEVKRAGRKRKILNEEPESVSKNPKIWEDIYDEESPLGSPNYLSPASPGSSRSMSPTTSHYSKLYLNDCDSETYSPVCSGDENDSSEDDEDDEPSKSADFDIMKLLETALKTETNLEDNLLEKEDDDDFNDDNFKSRTSGRVQVDKNGIDVIDRLLFKVTIMVGNRGELAKPETLNTIVNAIITFGRNNNCFGSSLTNILSESKFLAIILKQDIVHQLYKMTRNNELSCYAMNFLDTLTCVAETYYGRGEVLRLLKTDNIGQKRIVLAIAFIIKSPKFLYNLLTENGALYILINTILNKNDDLSVEAADGLTSLAQNLGISTRVYDKTKLDKLKEFDESNFKTSELEDNEIKFIIHRGCSKIPIKFSKSMLLENSDVFQSMFNSNFRESSEGEIHLNNYTIHGIKYFLNLIQLKCTEELPNIPPIYHFESILEAYELSKLYIIPEIEKVLFSMLVYRLNAKTCLKVFEWSLKNCNQELSEVAINYYLCSVLEGTEKVELFRVADYSEHSKEWNQMIIDAILVKCQNLCSDSIN